MAPNTINNTQPLLLLSLLLVIIMFYPTLKLLNSLKGGLILNPAHASSSNGMNISAIGKDSIPKSIMDIAPANALIRRKAASFENLVWTVSKLKVLHTSSELIHFVIQKLPVETISALQEAQIVSTSVQNWVIDVATLKPQAFLDGNMEEVTTDMSIEPAKQSPRILKRGVALIS